MRLNVAMPGRSLVLIVSEEELDALHDALARGDYPSGVFGSIRNLVEEIRRVRVDFRPAVHAESDRGRDDG